MSGTAAAEPFHDTALEREIAARLAEHMRRVDTLGSFPREDYEKLVTLGERGVALLEPYMVHADSAVRRRAGQIVRAVAGEFYGPVDATVSQKYIDKVIPHLRDTDAAIRQGTARALGHFPSSRFSPYARENIAETLRDFAKKDLRDVHAGQAIVLLAGVAGLESERETLLGIELSWARNVIGSDELLHQSIAFSARLARARLGDEAALESAIRLVDSHPDADYRATRFFELVAYTRQPEAVEYLWKFLPQTETTTYESRDVVNRPYWQLAAIALASMLEGTPSTRFRSSTQAEWLAWMEAHKDNWPLKR